MKTLRIRNQKWVVSGKYLKMALHEPYWGASAQYGWEPGIEGYSISTEAIEEAEKLNKILFLNIGKYGNWEISPKLARKYGHKFIPRDNKPLLCIPRTAFTKVKQPTFKIENGVYKAILS